MFIPLLASGTCPALGCSIVNVGVIANPHKPGSIPTLLSLRKALALRGISMVLDEETAALAGEAGGIPASSFSQHVDVAAVIGGDGTMLHALSRR